MSYILPSNTKSGIILYMDSRDASSYLAQKIENIGTVNEYTADLTSYFQYVLTENIEVPLNQRALVSLNSATIPYSFYNIRTNINDTLIYTVSDTVGGNDTGKQTLTLESGNYTAYSLASAIESQLNSHSNIGSSLYYTFAMDYDSDKNKFILSISTNSALGFEGNQMRVDLFFEDSEKSCNVEMGFRPLNHEFFSDSAKLIRTSQNVIDINGSIHGVYVRSNLVSKGTLDSQNGTLSNILARLPINVQSGGIIFGESNNHKSVVDLRYVNTITIRLTDERNRILDLNGLHFQLAIQIDFIHAKKPVSIPMGALSKNPELSFHNHDKLQATKERRSKITPTNKSNII